MKRFSLLLPLISFLIVGCKLKSSYTVTFNGNGGTLVSGSEVQSVTSPDKIIEPVYEKPGYSRTGWDPDIKTVTTATTIKAMWEVATYTITYHLNGGNEPVSPNPKTYKMGDTLNLHKPSKAAYSFGGWYDNSKFIGNPISKITSEMYGDKNLYAKWTADTYSITYHNVDPSEHSNPPIYTIETPTITLKIANRKGYYFNGWYTDETYQTKRETIEKGSIGNITLYARWTPKVYQITYKDKGGSNYSGNNEEYLPYKHTYNEKTTLINGTKNGFNFIGWYLDSECTGNPITEITATSIGDMVLYAKWSVISYNITYELNGGTNDPNNPSSYTIEDVIPLKSATKENYKFAGWYENASFQGEPITEIKSRTGDLTLYAKWVDITFQVTYYDLCYKAGTGFYYEKIDGSEGKGSGEYKSGTILSDTKPDDPDPYEPYFSTFDKWYLDKSHESEVDFDQPIKSNIDIYANYKRNESHVLYLFKYDDIDDYRPYYPAVGTVFSAPEEKPTKEPKEDYKFKYWYDSNDPEGKAFDFTQTVQANKDILFYPSFQRLADYKVEQDTHDEGVEENSVTINGKESLTKAHAGNEITVKARAKTGYTLDKIQVSGSSGTLDVEFTGDEAKFTMIEGDVKVKVLTKLNSYTLSFDANVTGGTAPEDMQVEYKSSIKAAFGDLKATYSEGQFRGWGENKDDENIITTDDVKMPHENKTIYAKWNKYTFTFEDSEHCHITSIPMIKNRISLSKNDFDIEITPDTGYAFTGKYDVWCNGFKCIENFNFESENLAPGVHEKLKSFPNCSLIILRPVIAGAKSKIDFINNGGIIKQFNETIESLELGTGELILSKFTELGIYTIHPYASFNHWVIYTPDKPEGEIITETTRMPYGGVNIKPIWDTYNFVISGDNCKINGGSSTTIANQLELRHQDGFTITPNAGYMFDHYEYSFTESGEYKTTTSPIRPFNLDPSIKDNATIYIKAVCVESHSMCIYAGEGGKFEDGSVSKYFSFKAGSKWGEVKNSIPIPTKDGAEIAYWVDGEDNPLNDDTLIPDGFIVKPVWRDIQS